VRQVRPDLDKRYNPWDSIVEEAAITDLFISAGASTPASHPTTVNGPEDWWAIVMGSGLRGTIAALTGAEAEQVKEANAAMVRERAPLSVRADVFYAIAEKAA
jgi:hypothetical protein